MKPKRCVVYTRKSQEEGLDQEFNSLDAQREAGMAYIASQKHEGWVALAEGYDDGGFSGGNMERPALRRLLADIDAGQIDVIVVYKIDRLSRSLADFVKMVELFDRHGVTFVSVTQQFNTTTSMGRLTLNILLSFAQFEREVTGERIRDKIAASKRKGLWMGGVPPLGYDVAERKLIINPAEAELVRHIFQRLLEVRSDAVLVRELALEGRTTKRWTTQDGRIRPGKPIDKQFVFKLLRNRVYRGEIVHKGVVHPGQHEAIISADLWDQVHALLAARPVGYRAPTASTRPALLAGLLYSAEGERMLPSFTQKPNGKRYSYYLCGLDKRHGAGTSRSQRLPAADIERMVLEQVKAVLQAPELLVGITGRAALTEPQVVVAMRQFGAVWDHLFPAEQQRLLRLLIHRVNLRPDGLDIVWIDAGFASLLPELAQQPLVKEQREWQEAAA